jgi:hypothetical protein
MSKATTRQHKPKGGGARLTLAVVVPGGGRSTCCIGRKEKTKIRQDKTRQDKTRQDKTRPGNTLQEKITPPSDTEETKTNTRKKARMEGTYLKIGGKNIQFKKALASGILKKVQRKCTILFFIPNVVFLEFIMTHLLSLYI